MKEKKFEEQREGPLKNSDRPQQPDRNEGRKKAAAAGTSHPYNDKREAEEDQPDAEGKKRNTSVHKDHDDNLGRETLGNP